LSPSQPPFTLLPRPPVAGCHFENIGWATGNHEGDEGSKTRCWKWQRAAAECRWRRCVERGGRREGGA